MTTATRPGAPQFPSAATDIPASDHAALDAALQELHAHKDEWVAIGARDRAAMMDTLIADFAPLADRWVAACAQSKGLSADAPAVGEEWATGPYTLLKEFRQLRQSLLDIAAGSGDSGSPRIPGPVKTRSNGQVVAGVFPQNTYDRIFYGGLSADIWMQPGVTKDTLAQTQAVVYHDKQHPGKVALVLGAGNVSSIGPLDVLYKLFVEDQVVIFKANPVNAYLGPLIEQAFRSLIARGFLRMAYGGAAEGAYLCNSALVDEIHITGSDKTFDAIVFGPGADGAQRKAERRPLLTKRITGELGNVSPVIVVPGPWNAGEIAYQAAHIASMLTNNAGFNCNATRVILQHAGWKQRDALNAAIRGVLAKVPPRPAYYPGAQQREQAFVAAHPEAERIGAATGDELPWTFITGVDPARTDDIVFTTEAFCSLFAETALAAESVADYIERAVAFANDDIWGTLNATLIVHPASLREPKVRTAVERAIANLRYGSIGVNYWAGTSFVLGVTTWGAFPGHSIEDIQSGVGVVHNTLMFDKPQKSVLRAPFRTTPTPPWFVTRANAGRAVFRKLAQLEAAPSFGKVPSIVLSALRG
ncbi:MAG: NAD-dependent aldehyde dehydrogenase [Ktedonobacterales bacterium]